MADEDVSVDNKVEGDEQDEMSEEEAEKARLAEAVTVQAEDIGTLRQKLTVSVNREHLDEKLQKQFAELKREAQVAGFRKGRAPLRLIEKRFGRDVDDQMTGPLVGNAFLAALDKANLKDRTIGDPLVWVKVPEERSEAGKKKTVLADKLLELDKAVEYLHLPSEGPLAFSCEVELRPEFELPKIQGIPLVRSKVEITDEMVNKGVDNFRAVRGHFAPVEGGEVQADDLLVVGYKCTVGNRVLAEASNRTLAARDQRLEGIPVEGLGQALVGKRVDDVAAFTAAVPDDYDDGELRGQQAKFEFVIRDVKRLKLPEIDAEFLASLGVDTKEELLETIRADLEVRRTQMGRDEMRSSVRDYLLDNTTLELPEGLSQRQTDRAVARRMIDLYRLGVPQQEVEKRIDQLKASAAEEAVQDLKFFFIMEQIAKDLEVRVTEEEINSVIGGIAQRSGQRFDRVRDELGRSGLENLYIKLRDEKILDKLVEDAEVTEAGPEGPKGD